MNRLPTCRRHLLVGLAALSVVAGACGKTEIGSLDDPPATTTTEPVTSTTEPAASTTTTSSSPTTTVPVQDPEVGRILAGWTDWTTDPFASEDTRVLEADDWTTVDGTTKSRTECAPRAAAPLSRVFDEYPAWAFTGALVPGLVVEGGHVEDGDLRAVPLDRAPLTLVSTLDSADMTAAVDRPDSVTLAEAVSTLRRDADARISGGVDVVPLSVTFHSSETHSFEQSSIELGASVRYADRTRAAGLDVDFEQTRGVETHSVVVRMIQDMYTLRVATDGFRSPGEYFAPTVTPDDLRVAESGGTVGGGNVPVLIDTVTYGRILYFTMSSTTATSADELRIAIEASYGNWEGDAEYTQRQQEIVSSADISLIALGGNQGSTDANGRNSLVDLVKQGDYGAFFESTDTTTAAPLSFTLRTLDGDPVVIEDVASVNELVCQSTPQEYEFNIQVSNPYEAPAVVYLNNDRIMTVGVGETAGGWYPVNFTNGDPSEPNLVVEFTRPGLCVVAAFTNSGAEVKIWPDIGYRERDTRSGRMLDSDPAALWCSWEAEYILDPTTGAITAL